VVKTGEGANAWRIHSKHPYRQRPIALPEPHTGPTCSGQGSNQSMTVLLTMPGKFLGGKEG
jgi:hypothetical protein